MSFYVGNFKWHFFRELPRYFFLTLFYVTASSLIGILIGFPLGMLRYKKRFSIGQKFLFFLNTIPDFFLILFLQLVIVSITQLTGFRIARISGANNIPLLLPLIAMSFYPILYLIKTMAAATHDISCQDYILNAKSRGFSQKHIFFKEIMPGLVKLLEGDITKVTLMVLSNIFIAERLLWLNGITKVLFHYGFTRANPYYGGGYHYVFVVNCLIYIFLLFVITRTILKLFIWLFKKGSYA